MRIARIVSEISSSSVQPSISAPRWIEHTFGRPHQRHRADQAGQLIHGIEHLFHLVLRLDIHGQFIAVACGRVDQPLVEPALAHDLLLLDAVLLRKLLEIEVVQKSDNAPEIDRIAVAELFGKIAHHAFHGLRVL